MHLANHIQQKLSQIQFLNQGTVPSLLVAVSGGVDSVVLLHLLSQQAKQYALRITVAHLNHGLRGEDALGDEQLVQSLAHQQGWPVLTARVNVLEMAQAQQLGWEEAGRKARYAFLAKTAQEVGASLVVVAHHADDQAETILMHMLQGCHLRGLCGMEEQRPLYEDASLSLWRPLLEVRKEQLLLYAEAQKLAYRIDQSNSDTYFLRNWIRQKLYAFNPLVRRLSDQARRYYEQLKQETEMWWQMHVHRQDHYCVCPWEEFAGLSKERQVALLSKAYDQSNCAGLVRMSQAQSEELAQWLKTSKAQSEFVCSGSMRLKKRYRELWIEFDCVAGMHQNSPHLVLKRLSEQERLALNTFCVNPQGTQVYINAQNVCGAVRIRPWRAGDRIRPLGLLGVKKVKDILIDAKVVQEKRQQTYVVEDDRGVFWLVGHCLDERMRCTKDCPEVALIVVQ